MIAALAALGFAFTLAAVGARRRFVGAALFTLATEYALAEVTGHVGSGSVVPYTVVLVVCTELLLLAGELPAAGLVDRAALLAALGVIGAIAVAAALLGLVALAATTVRIGGGFEAALLGSAAAVALLALPVLLLRRTRE